MWLFLLFFLALYGAMNSYLLRKVWTAFPELGHIRLALAGFLLLMVLAPAFLHELDRRGWLRLASALGAVGYTWMAVAFWFSVFGLSVDAWNLVIRAAARAGAPVRGAVLPPRPAVIAIGVLIAVGVVWGLLEARAIRLRKLTIEVPGLPAAMDGLTIAQVSDLHLGVHTGPSRLEKAIRLIQEARPDVLVCTGDLADSPPQAIGPMAEALAAVKPPLGKFAVLGNHEFYMGLGKSLEFLDHAGFRVLRREAVTVGEGLVLAGVDDPAGASMGLPNLTDEDAILPGGKDRKVPTILLKHQPVARQGSPGRFDLQLSGHAHGGQLWPWHIITRLVYRHYRGMHGLPGGSQLYATCGTGTWGPPLRVLARPEVALITLKAARP